MSLYKFGNFCVKCNEKGDCNIALKSLYDELNNGYTDEVVITGLETVLRQCGDGKCGSAIINYRSLEKYLEK